MLYTSFGFYIFLLATLILYYIIPLRFRWLALMAGSLVFYIDLHKSSPKALMVTAFLVCATYVSGLLINHTGPETTKSKKTIFALAILVTVLPWIFMKGSRLAFSRIAPIGISFYTLQMVSYLADIYAGKIEAQKNIVKYVLYILFFPQIIQGPIPRYGQLSEQLYRGHLFDEKRFVRGAQLILWGFFLKLMIADKSAIVVDTVFGNPQKYTGCYIWVAGVLYSIELYTDFLACVTISRGTAGLFGIELVNNFKNPYLATSIKDFWRRWHISLSEWLRDYIYIPLGGSKKGRIFKYINLVITFAVSGIWHGHGLSFLFWGMMHAGYQIAAELTTNIRCKLSGIIGLSGHEEIQKTMSQIGVFFWTTLAWVIFRAVSLKTGLYMVKSMFTVNNAQIFFNGKLLTLGLEWQEWCVLAVSVMILMLVEGKQYNGFRPGEYILGIPLCLRWSVYILTIVAVVIFGTYGFGFNAQDFIYGGF